MLTELLDADKLRQLADWLDWRCTYGNELEGRLRFQFKRDRDKDVTADLRRIADSIAELEARLAARLACAGCGGSGKAGTTPINCPSCGGTGVWP